MSLVRSAMVVATLVAGCTATAGAVEVSGSSPAEGPIELQCTPVDTWWPASSPGRVEVEAPRLSVLVTDVRPKSAVVLLDGRIVGRSRYLNGSKGFLYLEPGDYTLEIRLDGYRPETFTVAARPGCRFDVRHRMVKNDGIAAGPSLADIGKGEPEQRVWKPVAGSVAGSHTVPPAPRGADLSLRPDLAKRERAAAAPAGELGSLRLRVAPGTATVYLDGTLLATARELELMVAPLAVPAGTHRLEIRAPGHAHRSQEIEVVAGEVTEVTLALDRSGS